MTPCNCKSINLARALAAAATLAASTAWADITSTGDVSPADASTWTTSTTGYIGNTSIGSVLINAGSSLSSSEITLGNNTGSSGMVTVDGVASTLTALDELNVGNSGSGTLKITDGGTVSTGDVNLAENYDSADSNGNPTGQVTVDGTGSALSCQFDIWAANYGPAAINITNGGSVSDANAFIGMIAPASATVNGIGSTWTTSKLLDVGDSGSGSLRITNGGNVSSNESTYLGDNVGSSAVVAVDGTGSTLKNTFYLYVGNSGAGTLTITNGGQVSNAGTNVGYSTGGNGIVTVDGADSIFTNTSFLNIGGSGTATLNIFDGGTVITTFVSINKPSILTVNVGDTSVLNDGTGTLNNGGTIRFRTVPAATAGTYTPITAASWVGSGIVQALGGVWSTTSHTVTVSPAANGTTGQAVTVNLFQTQRIAITDPTSGNIVDAAFPSTAATSNLTFTASLLTAPQGALLASTDAGNVFLSGWTFTASNYTTGTPVFLSLDIGPGYSASTLSIWHFDGTTWTPYTPTDLSYDGTYANFTVTGFSGYAVTSTTPEPASLALLALGAVGLLVRRSRKCL